MELLYKNEHLSCLHYATSETVCFRVYTVKKGDVFDQCMLTDTNLMFLLSGSITLSYNEYMNGQLESGNFCLLPKSSMVHVKVKEDGRILSCIFSQNIKMCSLFSLQQLQNFLPASYSYEFGCLQMNPLMNRFLCLLVDCLDQGLGCSHFHQLKRDELFLYLRAFYTKEELACFFYPILGEDMNFKDFVLANYKQMKDVKDFAEKANLSLSTFNRRFRENFHISAHQWLISRKVESVRRDILMSNLTFSEIADKYNFSSPNYLATFCRQHYGMSPHEMRVQGRQSSGEQDV